MKKLRIIGVDFYRFIYMRCPECGSEWRYDFDEYKSLIQKSSYDYCPGCECLLNIRDNMEVRDFDINEKKQDL